MSKITAGAKLVTRLHKLGVQYVFCNSGTDFPPIIEGIAEAQATDRPIPEMITAPHETAALAMAHGAYFATGQTQAVMVHTNVGLANAVIGALNAASDNIPMLIFSGRTPVTEEGRFGSRTVPIGWGQEMMDQHALMREACKWDYELRFPEQIEALLDRAYAIANSHPKGPVYISLPREVLCETLPDTESAISMRPAQSVGHPRDIEKAAEMIAKAKSPVILAQRGAGSEHAFNILSDTVTALGIPVCQYWALQLAIPTDHPMSVSANPTPLLEEADVILCLDSLAPWEPAKVAPRDDAQVIQIGSDPLFARTPIRNFPADLSIAGDLGENVIMLCNALQNYANENTAKRAKDIASRTASSRAAARKTFEAESNPQLTKSWISKTLANVINSERGTLFAELGAKLPEMALTHSQAWYESPHSGGLGFGLPAAMGYRLAAPDRLVIATIGDGSYMFANPIACHQICAALGLSPIVIIMNNSEWNAVRASVTSLYPNGAAVQANSVPLTDLSPSFDFQVIAAAAGGWGTKAETKEGFLTALERALNRAKSDAGVSLIDARIARD
jgi:acetolactate synthase-1/2/3 large subunit